MERTINPHRLGGEKKQAWDAGYAAALADMMPDVTAAYKRATKPRSENKL